MKSWIHKRFYKAKKIVRSTRGETLMESIASLTVFLLLLLAVTMMIKTSLRITGMSLQSAKDMQDNANEVILSDYSGDKTTEYSVSIIFSSTDGEEMAAHEVTIYDKDGIIAFEPEQED